MEVLVVNLFSVSVLVILLISLALVKTKKEKSISGFFMLVVVVICFDIVDLLSSITEGKDGFRTLCYVTNLLSFLFVDFIIISFSAYLFSLMRTDNAKWKWVFNPGAAFSYLSILTTLILTATGHLFYIDEQGFYQENDLVWVPYAFSAIILVLLLSVVFKNHHLFSKKQMVVIICYLLLPIPAVVVELVFQIYEMTIMSLTLSILLIYVLVESSIIEGGRARESVLEEISTKDLLTGLNNRRAYYNRFTSVQSQQSTGVLFCDINGLKLVNDSFGHCEGDKLINRFSTLLVDAFRLENVFRISGDEFVVVISDISSSDFTFLVDAFKKTVENNNKIAAIGASFGTGERIEQLVSEAEKAMYENKDIYYKENPRYNQYRERV